METIINYLNTMFATLPQNGDVLRAKEELSQLMEDKFHALIADDVSEHQAIGRVISEFGDIEDIKETFGLNKLSDSDTCDQTKVISLSSAQVNQFYEDTINGGMRVAMGVALIIIGVIPIVVSGIIDDFIHLPDYVTGIATIMLFGAVAFAVFTFIQTATLLKDYEHFKKHHVKMSTLLKSEIEEEYNEFNHVYTRWTAIAVALFIVSVMPTVWTGIAWDGFEPAMATSLAFMLLTVALGVFQLIHLNYKNEMYKLLLNQSDEQKKINADRHNWIKIIETPYWMIILLIYFGLSFTQGWHVSWLIWPVSGACFVLLQSISDARKQRSKSRY